MNARYGGKTLLNLAVSCAHKDIVLALLAAGADVNAKDWCGEAALLTGCDRTAPQGEQGRSALKDIVSALFAAGADVHAKDALGRTALHLACDRQWEEVVQALIDRGSPVDEVFLDSSPLKLARGNRAISMSLLRAAASCEGLSEKQKDDLFLHACHVGDLLAVDILLKNGCSVGILSREEQKKLLRSACRESNLLVAGTLLKNGCHVCTLSREEQEELLCCACRKGDILVAGTLLQAICSASELTHTELVQLLSPVPKLEKEGLLLAACHEGDMLVVEALIAVGCSVNCMGSTGGTPFMNAACQGQEEVVRKLILAGANLAMKDENGSTALPGPGEAWLICSGHSECQGIV